MIGDLWQKGTARFPSAPSIVQAAGTALGLGGRVNALNVSAVAIAAAAVAFAGIVYVRHAGHADDAQLAASRVESANVDLQDQLANLRDKVAASSRDLAAAQAQVAALTEEMRAKLQQDVRQVTQADQAAIGKTDKVTQLSTALHQAEAQRATLAARLSKAEAELADQQARQNDLLGQIDQWQKRLEQLSSDRDKLKARVVDLEKQSALRHATQTAAAAQPAPAPAAPTQTSPAQSPPARVAGVLNAPAVAAPQPAAAPVAHGAVDQFARVLASAGVDVRQLFAQFGVNQAAGGPFIPVHGQAPSTTLSPDRLAGLRAMIKTLPVSAPLAEFDVSSPFGVRGDPENGHAGFHTGIDLTAPYDTPVYATAPGTVSYAGWRDDYGKIVEIDHGNGIATRYAHLHAFTVSVGQRVAAHQQVGYLGSTGRATGPHVHYEVVVNGEPQDPEKFFNLSRYVPAMTVPVAARN